LRNFVGLAVYNKLSKGICAQKNEKYHTNNRAQCNWQLLLENPANMSASLNLLK